MAVDFEKSFSDYLDGHRYDEAESALFSIVRNAYQAGWDAVGGAPPKPQDVLHIIKNNADNSHK